MAARDLRAVPQPQSRREAAKSVSEPQARSMTPKSVPKTLKAAAEISERAALIRIRDMIAEELDRRPPPAPMAALTKHFLQLMDQIRELDSRPDQDGDGPDTDDEAWDETSI